MYGLFLYLNGGFVGVVKNKKKNRFVIVDFIYIIRYLLCFVFKSI